MRKLLKEPLVHFLLIGFGLFLTFHLIGGDSGGGASKRIVVDKDALLTFMQYRSKAFNEVAFERQLATLSDMELRLLIDDFVREEALYREAKTLQLDRDDYIIRRRLIQKLEFITKGFADASSVLDDSQVRQFFEDNKQDYYVEPYVTFTHVFYDRKRRGDHDAARAAESELKELNLRKVPFTDAPSHGDRFFYNLNYVERTPAYVASHFGRAMAAEIFELPSGSMWQGPFESPYGYHVVLVSNQEEGRYPEVQEIQERVAEDARQATIREQAEEAIAAIVGSYDAELTYAPADQTGGETAAPATTGAATQ